MDNKNQINNNEKQLNKHQIDRKLENMRNAVIDEQRCKEIAQKLTEYIKNK